MKQLTALKYGILFGITLLLITTGQALAAGDTKSCRKDSTKYIYSASGNAKPKFTTSGTTLNNNHCELVSKE